MLRTSWEKGAYAYLLPLPVIGSARGNELATTFTPKGARWCIGKLAVKTRSLALHSSAFWAGTMELKVMTPFPAYAGWSINMTVLQHDAMALVESHLLPW